MKTIVLNYREPKVLNRIVKNGKLELILDWYQLGKSRTVITKTPFGFTYEDVGMFKRNFTDLDFMIWEFELPKSLKEVIMNLPLID